MFLYLRMLGRDLQLKATALLVFSFVVSKIFEKLLNNTYFDRLERGILRQNEKPCMVWAPKLGLGKMKQHSVCFLFAIIL